MARFFLSRSEYTRRQYLIGLASAVVITILLTLGIEALTAYLTRPTPLKPGDGDAQSNLEIDWLPSTVTRWQSKIEQYSAQYHIDPNLTAIIMTVESGGDPKANSGLAKGLMQISDARAKDIAAKFLNHPRSQYDLYDPDTSIEFGVANLRQLIKEFGDPNQAPTWNKTVGLVSAGYNGGEGAGVAYLHGGLANVKNQQTHNYIRFVATMWSERHDDKSFAYRYWYDQANGQALISAAQNQTTQTN